MTDKDIRETPTCPYAPLLGGATPPPEDRIAFLRQVQRLLKEGDFTATYKFALLQALLDLSVESRIADGRELPLSYLQIGEKFVEYYWNHTEPYGADEAHQGVLVQSNGRQAKVISGIDALKRSSGFSILSQFRLTRELRKDYNDLVKAVANTVRDQPVRYIHNLNGTTVPFLFEVRRDGLTLKPGVAWCLQEFYDLIQGQLRSRWVEQVRNFKRNGALIGKSKDLEVFLFGNQRVSLEKIGEVLSAVDRELCFYCGRVIRSGRQVDHFIPWSRYPRDLGHNFVLAHAACNNSKRDALAARQHLAHWLDRIRTEGRKLQGGMSEWVVCDDAVSRRVAQWAYRREIDASANFWSRVADGKAEYAAPDEELRRLVAAIDSA